MMDASEVLRIANAALEPMAERLQVRRWHIDLSVCWLDEHTVGECDKDPTYMRAKIRIDPADIDDEDDVLDTLRHELLHLVVAEFDVYYCAIDPDHRPPVTIWHLGMERTITHLERMLGDMGMTPRVLAGMEIKPAKAA